jgi:Ca2+-binding RTX toxin-like protein
LIIKDTATGASTITAENVILADALLEIQGGAGNDTITGSAYADLLDGGVGSDLLMGGDGSDTYVAVTTIDATTAEVEGTGTGVQSGMVINLSASAITNTTILSAMTAYTADTVTSVASNSAVHIYGTSASTNSAAVDTLAAIENVTGSAGADYIVGSVSANTISGGAGADYIIGGLGADTITIGSGANVIVQLTGASGAATASLADTITDFTAATAAIEIGTYTGDVSGGAADNYVEVPDAAYANYAAVLTALNTAAATLAGNSTATLIVVFAGDTTGTDNGYVGIDRDGGGTIDEVIILTGIVAAGISVADIT